LPYIVFFFQIYDNFKTMPQIKIDAPAKLNLHLNIGERRPDGFHDIESLFLALAYGDTLSFEIPPQESAFSSEDTEIILDWQLPWGSAKDLSPGKNIVNRAVSLFRKRTGFDKKLKIVIEKRIPLGGGLGGGSSDAAATLLALNRLASPEGLVSDAVLFEMGASLGSDVPFFLQISLNGASSIAWVSGRGELVRPLTLPPQVQSLSLVLVNPGFPSDTAKAFRLLDEYRASKQHALLLSPRSQIPEPRTPAFIPHSPLPTPYSLLPILSGSPRDWPFSNDFLPVFEADFKRKKPDSEDIEGRSSSFSAYSEIIDVLRELGADFSGLSGSGSTCFGVFSSQSKARAVSSFLLNRWNFVIETFLLAFKTVQWYNIQ
jgi:4-diphosphocytidyl-2-C-methyl-D-erythritol kinase